MISLTSRSALAMIQRYADRTNRTVRDATESVAAVAQDGGQVINDGSDDSWSPARVSLF